MSTEEYLTQSIVDADAYIHADCIDGNDRPCFAGLMGPAVEAVGLNEAEVEELVQFLLTLDGSHTCTSSSREFGSYSPPI